MHLPKLDMPPFPFQPDLPPLIHPCIVHTAIALPLLVIVLELINTLIRKKTVGVISFFFLLLLSGVLLLAYISGDADARSAQKLLSADVMSLLREHKIAASYLLYGSALLVLLKFIGSIIIKTPMRITYLLVLFVFAGFSIYTAQTGKALVYEHGVNVKFSPAPQAAKAVQKGVAPKTVPATDIREDKNDTNATSKSAESGSVKKSGSVSEAMTEADLTVAKESVRKDAKDINTVETKEANGTVKASLLSANGSGESIERENSVSDKDTVEKNETSDDINSSSGKHAI